MAEKTRPVEVKDHVLSPTACERPRQDANPGWLTRECFLSTGARGPPIALLAGPGRLLAFDPVRVRGNPGPRSPATPQARAHHTVVVVASSACRF